MPKERKHSSDTEIALSEISLAVKNFLHMTRDLSEDNPRYNLERTDMVTKIRSIISKEGLMDKLNKPKKGDKWNRDVYDAYLDNVIIECFEDYKDHPYVKAYVRSLDYWSDFEKEYAEVVVVS